ncbi:ABC transporter permease [Neorhizobium sp. NPDC001467]|uniref:ABC transporter permease n=1 Tax=Neorhizobium sp. NPDC001467 TaxID=3390595 RepID=UPI003D05AEB0
MIFAVLRVMTLGLLRDRGALVLAFVLPPAIFVVFASIFAASASDSMTFKVAVGRMNDDPMALRLEQALRADPSLSMLQPAPSTERDIRALVEQGEADVGLIIGKDLTRQNPPPITILIEPSKLMAGAILSARLQEAVARQMPDLAMLRTVAALETAVGPLTPAQNGRLMAMIETLKKAQGGAVEAGPGGFVHTEILGRSRGADATITYYAGAVSILFLLFAALQNAASLIDERNSGILDRIAVGRAGTEIVVLGKLVYLTLQGFVQVSLIFAVAAFVYDVEVAHARGAWLVITLAAACGASGLALAIVSLCATRQQAHTLSTFVVLIFSAVGGSMVPRFMMPGWLQHFGLFTPNAWVIEAYYGALWRHQPLPDLIPELSCILALAVTGTLVALFVSRRRLRY